MEGHGLFHILIEREKDPVRIEYTSDKDRVQVRRSVTGWVHVNTVSRGEVTTLSACSHAPNVTSIYAKLSVIPLMAHSTTPPNRVYLLTAPRLASK